MLASAHGGRDREELCGAIEKKGGAHVRRTVPSVPARLNSSRQVGGRST